MEPEDAIARIPIQVIDGALTVPIQGDLTGPVILELRRDLLSRLEAANVRGVVFDLSGVNIIDSHEFELLRRTLIMVSMMGSRAIVSGLKPGIAAGLVAVDADLRGVEAALSLDAAVAILNADATSN